MRTHRGGASYYILMKDYKDTYFLLWNNMIFYDFFFLDMAAASVMDNNELALALREPDLEKVRLTLCLYIS